MNNGILEITIPRKKEKSKTRIKITWQTIVFVL
jgi:HSP20 family molecular chaperone IbpA